MIMLSADSNTEKLFTVQQEMLIAKWYLYTVIIVIW